MTTTNQYQPVSEADRVFFERELASFVPDRVFDAHAHLWRSDFCSAAHEGPALDT